jgi:holo-[acyl-carrier-protein] synthase
MVFIPRFRNFALRRNHLIKTIFSEQELDLPLNSLAGNFAVKEALLKAGFVKSFRDYSLVSVLRNPNGKPYLEISPMLQPRTLSIETISVSISNEANFALAVVLINY